MSGSLASKLSVEIATYEANRAKFVDEHPDEYVLIKADKIVGFYANEIEAIKMGYQKFEGQAFLVRRVAESETPILIHRCLATWTSSDVSIESLEDQMDVEAARKALRSKSQSITWSKAKAALGL